MKFLAFFLCLVLSCSANTIYKKEWTKLILTHHWPQTFCSMESCTTDVSYWAIHGLWPDTGNTCNSSWPFNASLIEDLMPQMKTYWPDLLKPASTQFWKHEWTKHGTCAAKAEALNSQHKYFSKALELYHKLDLSGVLNKSGIVPSEEAGYKLEDIEGSLIKSFGVMPKIQCVHNDKTSDTQTLGQIEICFERSEFQLMDCEKRMEGPEMLRSHPGFSVCKDSVPIYYPPVESRLKVPKFL